MTTSHHTPPTTTGQPLGLADIIRLLGHRHYTSIMQKEVGANRVRNHHVTPGIVPALVDALAPSDVWYGVNEITEPPGGNRRATEATVTTWCAVWADLDIKHDGCPTWDIAEQIIDDLAGHYGTRPTYTVQSGHGLQPVWVIDHHDPARHLDTDEARTHAAALLRRHGRLVHTVAEHRGARVDSVFDLPRVLRAPGTTNHKQPDHPKPTSALRDAGKPVTTTHVAEALDAARIDEIPTDTAVLSNTVIAAPSTWRHRDTGDQRCKYVDEMIDGWGSDHPNARHPWLISQATRLAAARRHSCINAADAHTAEHELAARFLTLCARGGDTRPAGRHEVADALRYGSDLVARMTDARVADELGNHTHSGGMTDRAAKEAAMSIDFDRLRNRSRPTAPTTAAPAPSNPSVKPDNHQVNTPSPAAAPDTDDTEAGEEQPYTDPTLAYIEKVEQIENGFWTRRPALELIHDAAHAETAAPWAVLATVLMRILADIPHDVYLPGLGGPHSTPGSLNAYAGIVSKPSGGKGTANKVAERLYPSGTIYAAGAGSGEGVGQLFGNTVTDKQTKTTEFVWHRRSVLLEITEVDALTAMTRRDSSTIDAVLRQAFSGEGIMFSYAAVEKRLRMPAGEYRLTGVVHVQPGRAAGLFDGADGGTPQRFIWAAAADPRIGQHDPDYAGETLTDHVYPPHYWGHDHVIDVCDEALQDVRAERIRRAQDWTFTDDPDDPEAGLGGHTMYARLKIAAALAALDRREYVNPEDWELSGVVIDMSNMVRTQLTEAMDAGRLAAAEKRGQERGAEQIGAKATETELRTTRLQSACDWIVKRIEDHPDGAVRYGDLAPAASKARRPFLRDALALLVDQEVIAPVELLTTSKGGRPGEAYKLV